MALGTDPSGGSEEVHTDVLAEFRQACYKARDAFYACVEKESDKKPTEIASVGLLYPAECKASRAEFVKLCRASWVKHFDRKFCQNSRVQRLLDDKDSRRGPLVLPQPYTFKPTS
ncbi:cytochrome c oxidase assembly factor 6 [Cucurbita pepo subsp. pepo]|uniref:cytochrome c oxidase assembly factor 6 n=1 Tax=Cucurbita pepo subsp. pepo TaxID=3664 RepID=UPI000C9D6B5C|nr:cytochrome c oxidase assembly factor 6 [Cucurbita pepo subsp. pepo]